MQRSLPITQAMIDAYGRINGDNDIIHYDHDYAVKRGFRGTLLHGPHMTALAADVAARKYGEAWLRGGRLHTKWIGPVCPDDLFEAEMAEAGELTAQSGGAIVLVGSATLVK